MELRERIMYGESFGSTEKVSLCLRPIRSLGKKTSPQVKFRLDSLSQLGTWGIRIKLTGLSVIQSKLFWSNRVHPDLY